ncbi:uncharacterized protein N7483_010015 [Penicillium malachiteum]|uniref:uncharacterized protein n=1 Tax=Penicillium malachiteum TaxID=1324776 RepID=UPI00254697A1|nr:uncharacterized protein N7483_010015 [Penicillium malachiteum]KAJ5718933.1 hypothetical protein N7483_010015 [Penicillium malachiteum]
MTLLHFTKPLNPRSRPDLTLLPQDVFWLILDYLTPEDIIRCRRVSLLWNAAFGDPPLLARMLKIHFPWTDEAQSLQLAGALKLTLHDARRLHDKVAARYHRLRKGNPLSVRKLPMCNEIGDSGQHTWLRVPPWTFHASHLSNRIQRGFPEAMWSHEDGLLVYPNKQHHFVSMMDVKKNQLYLVPFVMGGKVVRRIRLHLQLLVIEWAQESTLYRPDHRGRVHGHFASSYDIIRKYDGNWSIVPRNEWQIVNTGHPIGENDRFFSAHNRDYYVVYVWQPSRSLNQADTTPRELLTVWDISKRSSYRPSIGAGEAALAMGEKRENFPSMIARFDFEGLSHIGLRQREAPSMQGLHITNDGKSIIITKCQNTWLSMDNVIGLPRVIRTTFPLQGQGPHRQEVTNLILPPYRSNSNIDASFISPALLFVDDWYGLIAQQLDDNSGVSFCLHFNVLEWFEHADKDDQNDLPLKLTIQTKFKSQVTRENLDFSGTGKISAGENYVIGENRNNQLVIYRFD